MLSIVLPAYNEEKRIPGSLQKMIQYLNNSDYLYEIIVVDDGSTDHTLEVATAAATACKNFKIIQNKTNRGKGYAVKTGVLQSKGEIILFSDTDLSTPIEELPKLLKYLQEGYDIAIGSRALPESEVRLHQARGREGMGRIFNFLVQALVIEGIRDTQCGFKCFKRQAAEAIFQKQRLNGFSFDVEILYLARKLGYRIAEVPVVWLNSKETKVSILRDPLYMLMDLLKIRYFDFMGLY
ncbi:MAG TPA: dolichyl-phosphate beta-glucosyltransferase [Candidatus Limnocylindrales bacterium]|nr:dolichyl-phosphate beta-glucosyltransferase [Candidatus Limnocylindrales bacterium]